MKITKRIVYLSTLFMVGFFISQIYNLNLASASYQEQLQSNNNTSGSYNGSYRSQWMYHFVFTENVNLQNITIKGKRLVSDSLCRVTARFQGYTSASVAFNALPTSDSDILFDFTRDVQNSLQNLIITPGDYYFYIDTAENNNYSGQSDCSGTGVGPYPYGSNYNTSFIYQNSDVAPGYFVSSGSASTVPSSNNDLYYIINNTTLPPPTCSDQIKNQDETDIDTGGICQTLSSNIMFFPGILGSRLYDQKEDGSDKELWVSSRLDSSQVDLLLNTDGSSIKNVYTKNDTQKLDTDSGETGIVDSVYTANIYQSFIGDLKQMKDDNLMKDYDFIPYDWRLSLDDIITKGHIDSNGNLSYVGNQDFSESYILKKLEDLQKSSKNGKVTIIAHSNGGLVTKALINKLKDTNSPLYNKIDKVIFVGVPQVGTPESVVTLLHGTGIAKLDLLMSTPRSRQLAENMQTAYNLLPSNSYFSSVSSTGSDSIISFKDLAGNYSNNISSAQELKNYVLGSDGRIKPEYGDTNSPNIGNSSLYNNADITHQSLDSWLPSSSTKIIQVAGWGDETISGLDYQSYLKDIFKNTKKTSYKPRFVIDGDGTVVEPSALWMSDSNSNTERWWVDLKAYNKPVSGINRDHKDILEVSNLRNFIKYEIKNTEFATDGIILKEKPIFDSNSSRLHFTLHSPLTLGVTDSQGRYTGQDPTTKEIKEEIPDVNYGVIGDVQFISIPIGISYTLKLKGYEQGDFSLDIDKQDGNNITQSTSFQGIPTSTLTTATMDITSVSDVSNVNLKVDEDGDGVIDYNLASKLDSVVNIPKYSFSGFLQPINDTAHQIGQSLSVFKTGSTIPVKFNLKDINGLDTQSEHLPVWSSPQKGGITSSPVDESIYNDIATTGNTFKWDSVNKQYIYNWSTKGLDSGYWYKISTKLDDGYVYSIIIGLR